MAGGSLTIELSMDELREITEFAVACAQPALAIFESDCPDDPRPRSVLAEARRFAAGGKRTKALRVTALAHTGQQERLERWTRRRSLRSDGRWSRRASAYLHPLAKSTQGPAYPRVGRERSSSNRARCRRRPEAGAGYIERARGLAGPIVVSVLERYPQAPPGGGRVGELLRSLDTSLRRPPAGT